MARRPVFIPDPTGGLVVEALVEFEWNPGFALAQKRRNIEALHRGAEKQINKSPLLEVSTKSPSALGQRLSAFNLHVHVEAARRRVPLEAAFQGSKVFARTGQHPELYLAASGSDAKKLSRQYENEPLTGFSLDGQDWPLEPTTAFYDWLYLRALLEVADTHRPRLVDELRAFQGFTDIEFNPRRSVNCQARSCALFVAITSVADAEAMARSPSSFITMLEGRCYGLLPRPMKLL